MDENTEILSPVSDYYFKYSDLSINKTTKLKWSLYAFFFFNSIMENLKDPEITKDIFFETDISDNVKKELTIDGIVINNFEEFKKEMETEYNNDIYNENSTIHFKLKLKAKEFIIIQNALFPKLILFE